MNYEEIKTKLNKNFRCDFSFISGYRCFESVAMFYISTKITILKGDLTVFFKLNDKAIDD